MPGCALHLRSELKNCTFLPRALLRQPGKHRGAARAADVVDCWKLQAGTDGRTARAAACDTAARTRSRGPLQGLSSLAQGPMSDTAHLLGRRSASVRTGAVCRICAWSCLRPRSAKARGLPHPAAAQSARLCWEHGAEGRCKAPRSLQSAAGLAILGLIHNIVLRTQGTVSCQTAQGRKCDGALAALLQLKKRCLHTAPDQFLASAVP